MKALPMRVPFRLTCLAVATLLGACTSVPPNDARGPGFPSSGTYDAEQRARDAALASGQSMALQDPNAPLDVVALAEGALAESERPPVEPDPDLLRRGPQISDENSFDAVSERLTIESDRARLAAQREAFEVIEPTALPSRPSGDLAEIVQFALSTSHPVGTPVYPRNTVLSGSGRNCNRYANPNEAQQAFLRNGGPERDRNGLDPDGDGYACRWDPTPFRLAVRN